MVFISMCQMLDYVVEFGYGVLVFNVNNFEQMCVIMEVVDKIDLFVIVQVFVGVCKYVGVFFLCYLIFVVIEEFLYILVVMYQDYGISFDVCQCFIQLGFSLVMMDGFLCEDGKIFVDYDYNVCVIQQIVVFVYVCGVFVEGELGCLGFLEIGMVGEEDGVGVEGVLDYSQLLIDLEEVVDFVKKIKVDVLVIVIGISYGVYKFIKLLIGDILLIQCIKEIYVCILDIYLVMYGFFLVLQDWLVIINEYGGEIKEIYGVLVEEIVEGIKYGVCKVNIDIDLCLVFIGVICCFLVQNLSEFDLCKYFFKIVEVMCDICIVCYEVFGIVGNVFKIKLIFLEGMFQCYVCGELDLKVN